MKSDDIRSQITAHLNYFQEMGITHVDIEDTATANGKDRAELLHELWTGEVDGCTICELAKSGRTNIVFGTGNPKAEIMFIGEGPGEEEDRQGLPFVGRSGQKLTEIIRAMGYERSDVYIANIVKCRPPGNRNPLPDEVSACIPYLEKQIQIIQPKVICVLGSVAAHNLLQVKTPITKMRGNFHEYMGIPVMPTYHPAYLLRNYTPKTRGEMWDDMKKILQYLADLKGAAQQE